MPMTPLPPAPSRADPATFADKGDAMMAALPGFVTEANALALEVDADATAAAAAAVSAADAAEIANAAVATFDAVAWVSGTTYALGAVVWSPANLQTYRRKVAGAGTTDPSADPTNWTRVNLSPTGTATRTSNTALTVNDWGQAIDVSGAWTQTIDAAATLGDGWWAILRNTGNGDVTLDPTGSETIDGVATYAIKPGFTVRLLCTGTGFRIVVLRARTYGNVSQHTGSGSFVVPADCFVVRAYAFGAGSAGTSSNAGAGGGCAYGDIAVTPGETVTLSISAGVAKVTTASVDRLTANPASGTTAGTASKHASITNGGAYSGGAGAAGNYGGGSSGSPLGAGVAASGAGGAGWGGAGAAGGGGGVGGAATSSASGAGMAVPSTDPLLASLSASAEISQSSTISGTTGSPGAGGSSALGTSAYGGHGGFGAGGGAGGASTGLGGNGGFGGGGGYASTGGSGGYGGGGGKGATPGSGGAAVIRIYY